MKRSDALKVIDQAYGEFVEDWLKADISNLEGFIPLNERILAALEDSGLTQVWAQENVESGIELHKFQKTEEE